LFVEKMPFYGSNAIAKAQAAGGIPAPHTLSSVTYVLPAGEWGREKGVSLLS
jgi:hypothetical protein